jgi:agmatinase
MPASSEPTVSVSPHPILNGVLGLPTLDATDIQARFNQVDAVIIGMPWDGGTTGLPGQRHGPEIVRKFSPSLGFNLDSESRLHGVRDPLSGAEVLGQRQIFDLGDLGGVPLDPRIDRASYYQVAQETAYRAARIARVPVFIGGDHSVTAATVTGVSRALEEPLHLVCFDAHCDVGPVSESVTSYGQLTHANFVNYLATTGSIAGADILGVRAPLPESHFPLPKGVHCRSSATDLLDIDAPTFLSIDLDVLSPEAFSATGHPEPGGSDLTNLVHEVNHVCSTYNIIGIDVVETTYSDRWSEEAGKTVAALLLATLRAVLGDN